MSLLIIVLNCSSS